MAYSLLSQAIYMSQSLGSLLIKPFSHKFCLSYCKYKAGIGVIYILFLNTMIQLYNTDSVRILAKLSMTCRKDEPLTHVLLTHFISK